MITVSQNALDAITKLKKEGFDLVGFDVKTGEFTFEQEYAIFVGSHYVDQTISKKVNPVTGETTTN